MTALSDEQTAECKSEWTIVKKDGLHLALIMENLYDLCNSAADGTTHRRELLFRLRDVLPDWKLEDREAVQLIDQFLKDGCVQNLCHSVDDNIWKFGVAPSEHDSSSVSTVLEAIATDAPLCSLCRSFCEQDDPVINNRNLNHKCLSRLSLPSNQQNSASFSSRLLVLEENLQNAAEHGAHVEAEQRQEIESQPADSKDAKSIQKITPLTFCPPDDSSVSGKQTRISSQASVKKQCMNCGGPVTVESSRPIVSKMCLDELLKELKRLKRTARKKSRKPVTAQEVQSVQDVGDLEMKPAAAQPETGKKSQSLKWTVKNTGALSKRATALTAAEKTPNHVQIRIRRRHPYKVADPDEH